MLSKADRRAATPFRQALSGLALTLLLAACGTPRDFSVYQETIAEFQKATDQTATVALEYVHGINDVERENELKLLREDPDRLLDARKLATPVLTAEALRARDRTFSVLKQYTQMLADLADSDASERWKAASERTAAAAELLIEDLSNVAPSLASLPITDAISPLRTISNVIAKEIIDAKRARALDAAIEKAAPAIQDISALLREDLEFVIQQRDTLKQQEISQLSIEYAQAQQLGNEPVRLAKLREIDQKIRARKEGLITLQSVLQTLDQFDAAHDSLLRYARSDKGPQDLYDLVAIVRNYAATAEEVFAAFKKAGDASS
ncbi:hypothetical protein [Pelagibius marinus]|uniref:hypothetical protein n=1 Tax=Pelagibius marinus TaxID=2762760 RepID=UPI001872B69F|nr:hypothetical protein [Pelagibius marinus]